VGLTGHHVADGTSTFWWRSHCVVEHSSTSSSLVGVIPTVWMNGSKFQSALNSIHVGWVIQNFEKKNHRKAECL